MLKNIFLHDPEMCRQSHTPDLLPRWEKEITQLEDLSKSKSLRSDFTSFWNMWPVAKKELLDEGMKARKRYAAFRLGNRLYRDVKFPIERNRFGEASVSLLDAMTVVSGLSNLNPTKEGEEKSFESQSVEKLVEFVKHRAAQGHQPKDLLPNDEIKNEVVTSAASFAESTAEGEVRSLEALGYEKLDHTLLLRHLTPRLKGDKHQLEHSIGKAMRMLIDEAYTTKDRDTRRAKNFAAAGQLIRVLCDAIEEDRTIEEDRLTIDSATNSIHATIESGYTGPSIMQDTVFQ